MICHLRTKHPEIQKAILIVRKSVDPYEYEQFKFPTNKFLSQEKVDELKQRLCKLATVRKRLPLLKEEREEIMKRRKARTEYVKCQDKEEILYDKIDHKLVQQQRLAQATRQAQACKGGMSRHVNDMNASNNAESQIE